MSVFACCVGRWYCCSGLCRLPPDRTAPHSTAAAAACCRRKDKARENSAALEVLPDLLGELDQLAPGERLLALVQGVLAANIFDWGAKACVDLYHSATILEMYREVRV